MTEADDRIVRILEDGLEEAKKRRDQNLGQAFDSLLGVTERVMDRDRKLRTAARDALELLEEREWQTEGDDIRPSQNYCESCGAFAEMPRIPTHKPDCKWVKTVKALRELTSPREVTSTGPDGPSDSRAPMHLENLLMGVVYVARGPRTVERPRGEVFGLPSVLKRRCDFVAGPFRNTILANGWVEKHIDPDDRSDIILVGTVEEVEWRTV
jgi:hypothetical protein